MGVLDDVFAVVPGGVRERTAEDASFSKRCPSLFEMLTASPSVNGRRRMVSTMTVVAEDGVWKAGLRDRDHAVSLWTSGSTLQEALDALERALQERPVAWRKTPTDPSGASKKY